MKKIENIHNHIYIITSLLGKDYDRIIISFIFIPNF